ncbi:hypothetical protein IFM89_007631 [Coptis chinensis]|uniref:Uncharacterized protein n=1 Tax=Coptis chinensis TaxID=261450 RepID=A0A835LR79_9MAGN|nr:hypothetical protein IFM89_007631 [Coptis chinensis]
MIRKGQESFTVFVGLSVGCYNKLEVVDDMKGVKEVCSSNVTPLHSEQRTDGDDDYEGSRDIFSFDTNTRSSNDDSCRHTLTKESTHLLAKRSSPALVAAHGNIYVFGANLFDPKPRGPALHWLLHTARSMCPGLKFSTQKQCKQFLPTSRASY